MRLRLDKLLTEMTEGSRSEVKQWIKKGQISVDGAVIKHPEIKVDPDQQEILFRGERIQYHQYEYYMLHKPQGVVSATTDTEHTTVVSLITRSKRKDLFPVGRLDLDTEGLLLITNDGALAHRLLSPKCHVDKTYLARIKGALTESDVERLEQGMDIGDDKLTLPAVVEWYQVLSSEMASTEKEQSVSQAEMEYHIEVGQTESGAGLECYTEVGITIYEGRYHQVKRMFAGLGKPVVYLKRLRMGSLVLDEDLAPGEYRELTPEEITSLHAGKTHIG
ncbi:MAG: pseudouridine synthase [Eubacteriales bacterium]|nr:pseudouridine synthase [Eubacteriales bacterium]